MIKKIGRLSVRLSTAKSTAVLFTVLFTIVRFFTVPLKLSFKDKDTRVWLRAACERCANCKLHHPVLPQPQKDRTL
jgi:hypothetical protein